MNVLNVDVVGYHNRMNRFIEEVMKSQSSNHSTYKEADKLRLLSFLSAMRFYLDYVKGVPEQDLPETNPRPYPLRENPIIQEVENEMVNQVINLLILCRDEMDASQSASYGSGIQGHDLKRQLEYITRIEDFIKLYIDEATPLDLPESSPRAQVQGPGQTGGHAG